MEIEEVLEAECEDLGKYITFDEAVTINLFVTEPESFKNSSESLGNEYNNIVRAIKEFSPAYEEEATDYFEVQEPGVIQNLLETEFLYLCQDNNDVIYLSAVLMHRIASGHPFGEGNKRTAYLASCMFLIEHQIKRLELDSFSIPVLDKDLLESLGDIAEDHESISPEKLASQYRKSVKQELIELMD